MKNIAFLALLILINGCEFSVKKSHTVRNDEKEIVDEFTKQITKDVLDDDINGSTSAAIVKGDEILWSGATGFLDPINKTIADTTTIYRIASITKSFTAFLLMQLHQDGVLNINDPVEKYLPEIKLLKGYADAKKITFQELASHTAGLVREPKLKDAATGPIEEWEDKILQSIPLTEITTRPGTNFKYSNIGYGILGLALSRAAGISYEELLNSRIFQPLNMGNSYLTVPEKKMKNVAKGMDGGPMGDIDYDYPLEEHKGRGYKVPNGGIYTTPNDLTKFMISNMGTYSALLDSSNLLYMQKIHSPETDFWDNYGIGYFIYKHKGRIYVGHSGSISGYTSYFLFDKESKYGVIILRNYSWGITEMELRSFALLDKLNKLNIPTGGDKQIN